MGTKSIDLRVQGDVFLVRSIIPVDAKKILQRPLAYGEVTGHSHKIEEDIEMYELDGVLYLKTDRPVDLKHEEHNPITIDKGTWKVGIVQEYDAFAEEARKVQD
jgi:hypothetical protein